MEGAARGPLDGQCFRNPSENTRPWRKKKQQTAEHFAAMAEMATGTDSIPRVGTRGT